MKQKILVFKGLDKITAIDTDGLKIPIAFMTDVHQNENEKLRKIIYGVYKLNMDLRKSNKLSQLSQDEINDYWESHVIEIIKSKCLEINK